MTALATLRLARPAVAAFAAMGVLWGTFAADLPDIKTMLAVDEAQLGLMLFLTPIAAVVAMLLAPLAGVAFGRAALPLSCTLMCLGFVLPGQASLALFPLALFAPNTQQILADFAPALDFHPDGRSARLRWAPSRRWACAVIVLLSIGILSLPQVSEFLYFQF